MTEDTPLAAMWRFSRMLRLADGPDEVHKMVIARRELNRRAKLAAEGGGVAASHEATAAPQPAQAG
jgi:acyl-CoA dehydrogenase